MTRVERFLAMTPDQVYEWNETTLSRITELLLCEVWETHSKGNGVVVTHIPTGWTLFSAEWLFGQVKR